MCKIRDTAFWQIIQAHSSIVGAIKGRELHCGAIPTI